jgi:L-ascorbate metabolism protein UlaG (beta-lactamase superfamily)
MKATWLLQGSLLFEAQGFRLLIDPYISDFVEKKQNLTRLAPPPLTAQELKPSAIYCTHKHIDHLDPIGMPEILKLNPGVRVTGPVSIKATFEELKFDAALVDVVKVGESFQRGPFKLTAVKAYHSDPESTGLLIEADGKLVYLSGDTLFQEKLADDVLKAAGGRSPDYAFICINGKLGNMDAAQALATVKSLKAKVAVPIHYGLFAENTADPYAFLADCAKAGVKAMKLDAGKGVDLN